MPHLNWTLDVKFHMCKNARYFNALCFPGCHRRREVHQPPGALGLRQVPVQEAQVRLRQPQEGLQVLNDYGKENRQQKSSPAVCISTFKKQNRKQIISYQMKVFQWILQQWQCKYQVKSEVSVAFIVWNNYVRYGLQMLSNWIIKEGLAYTSMDHEKDHKSQ